jgi:tetratricopeptide (TPR) repeat protein
LPTDLRRPQVEHVKNLAESRRDRRRFHRSLVVVIGLGLAWRSAYVLAQPASDPTFSRPMLDGAIYLEWARALARGEGGPPGAYYLAPLYPHVLALFLRGFGESFLLLYLLQQAWSVATAAFIGLAGRAAIGAPGALAAAALYLLYGGLQYFASVPLGETLALFPLMVAVLTFRRGGKGPALAAGVAIGIAALARPNLLLVPALWLAVGVAGRHWARAGLLAAGVTLAVLPVAARNYIVSGHLVLISSNGGITAYQGNGPGAEGIFTRTQGLSGRIEAQRQEATTLARQRSGLELDPVEADGWWGREALRVRAADPLGTVKLLAFRLALLLDSREHSLDYSPALDTNPWRLHWRLGAAGEGDLVPFGLLVGLAAAGLVLVGLRGSGGWETWTAIAACAATPLLFYVSSRYRLPTAALLTLPAGAGLAAVLGREAGSKRRGAAACLGLAIVAASFLVPAQALWRASLGGGLANRAAAYMASGDFEKAERDARRAVEWVPAQPQAWYNLGILLAARNADEEAEAAYRQALALDPGFAEAASNLGALLRKRAARQMLGPGLGPPPSRPAALPEVPAR